MRFQELFTDLFSAQAILSSHDGSRCSPDFIQSLLPSDVNAKVLSAESYSANSTFFGTPNYYQADTSNLPAHCNILIDVKSSETSNYKFALWLPEDWNQRLWMVGNSGFVGNIHHTAMGERLRAGFAAVSTDTGHESAMWESDWAHGNPERMIDFGWRSVHGSATLSKKLAAKYYESPVKYSYWSGCSTGGRQGIKELQIAPDTFDGVLSSAPAWWVSHNHLWAIQIASHNLPEDAEHHIPISLYPVISAEVTRQCDAVDGLQDGIIAEPWKCNFHPEELLCTPNRKTECLTAAQLHTLDRIYSDWVEDDQTFIFPGMDLGSEPEWPVFIRTPEPFGLGIGYVQDFLLNDTTWDWRTLNHDIVKLADQIDPAQARTDNYDLSPFQKKGGKLLMYHGYSDGLIPAASSVYFRDHVVRELAAKGVNVDDFFRLFLMPGTCHCQFSGHNAPWFINGADQSRFLGPSVSSVPGFEDSRHDAMLALIAWVEQGKAPDELVGTKFVEDLPEKGVHRQRMYCPYPMTPKLKEGAEDVDSGDSWYCQGGK